MWVVVVVVVVVVGARDPGCRYLRGRRLTSFQHRRVVSSPSRFRTLTKYVLPCTILAVNLELGSSHSPYVLLLLLGAQ